MSVLSPGQPYDDRAYTNAAILLALTFISACFNWAVILATYKSKELRTFQCILILYLAVNDCTMCCVLFFTLLYSIIHGSTTWLVCQLQGFFLVFPLCCSLLIFMSIALDRYAIVVRQIKFTVSPSTVAIMIVFITYAAFSALVPFLDGEGYAMSAGSVVCVGDWLNSIGWAIWCLITIVLAVAITALCYYLIFSASAATRRAVAANIDSKSIDIERRIAFKMMTVVIGYIVCWTPYCALFVTELITQRQVSFEWDAFATACIVANCFVNPLFYSLLDVRYRRAIVAILPLCCVPCATTLLLSDSSHSGVRPRAPTAKNAATGDAVPRSRGHSSRSNSANPPLALNSVVIADPGTLTTKTDNDSGTAALTTIPSGSLPSATDQFVQLTNDPLPHPQNSTLGPNHSLEVSDHVPQSVRTSYQEGLTT